MKKILNIFCIVSAGSFLSAQQTNTENYIYSKNCLDADCIRKTETVQYFDGLGRPKQSIAIKASPNGKDVVSHIEYDQYGRASKSYLPVPQAETRNGGIYENPLGNATAPGIYGSEKIYAQQIIENSPLERIKQSIGTGNAWSSRPVDYKYTTNTAGDGVKKYPLTTTWTEGRSNSVPGVPGVFAINTLMKTSVTDEDGNTVTEFKNGKGQTLLVRKNTGSENADTYYIYDQYGRLAYVVPPLASGSSSLDQTTLDNLCYQYRYDGLGRLVEKKLPGKGWEYLIYNKADQLVMSQDANLRTQNKWMLTKYDQFGRIVLTGLTNNTATRQSLQTSITAAAYTFELRSAGSFTISGMPIYYTNRALPASLVQVLNINYYDTYPAYSFNPAFPGSILGQTIITDGQNASLSTKALPTLSLVKNIEDDNWTKNYIFYDTKGRAVGTYSINHLGGYTQTESKLDFADVPQTVVTKHKRLATDAEKVITENFTYDHQNRMLIQKHKVDNNTEEILAQNKYNEFSQLESKKVGGISLASPLQTIDYKYNIRGWLSQINDPANLNGKLFGYTVRYTDPVYAAVAPGRYNGNIAEIDWNMSTVNSLKRYNYTYDKLNRLTDAEYAEPEATNPHNKKYDERLTYDLNGNIASLKRNAIPVSGTTSTTVDNLVYQYTGNRLDKVIENALNDTGYEGGNNIIDYDLNGNMINMKDKGIQTMVYNYLNLPNTLSISQPDPLMPGQISNTTLGYIYRADGSKLRKRYYRQGRRGVPATTRITDYLDGFQYSYFDGGGELCMTCRTENAFEEQAYANVGKTLGNLTGIPQWNLDFVPTAEGFYSFTENRYIYQYRDHLGNARVSFGKNSEGVLEVTDTNNYYPFGLNHIQGMFEGSNLGSYYSYKYNGKELQETGMYDYGARFYMPDLGRWGAIDPLAEQMRGYSPYNYAFNNPISFIDPDGRQATDWVHNRQTNSIYWNPDASSQATAGGNETYLGKSGTYTAYDGSTTALLGDGTWKDNTLLESLGVMNNLNALIEAGNNGPAMSYLVFGDPNAPTVREIPASNSPEVAMGNPSGQLAVAGLYGLQGATTEIGFSKTIGVIAKVTTTADGFLFGSINIKAPFNIPAQRFGQMSLGKSDFWGLRVGTSEFTNRTVVAIKQEWNSLTQYTSGIIPKGTPIKVGIIGPQGGGFYTGGSIQFLIESKSVVNQATKIIPR
ncbi:RHS repeat-associated core domain-containing protein [Chryseobacterium sp. L7]|uniref:RHS repeat-associated core domain-containing protein n=1 Tax=Chryseobacterium endalhagicum TaxID=2797638 RepID=A0ABS1QIW1_9FLAO|nr:DUF6443 domain-containing protein [Chryseobacterium endalhagicum]MBL1222496.1 RHS repeat-associated core domain-containing protein [Chryseobacterium endalhagicum]